MPTTCLAVDAASSTSGPSAAERADFARDGFLVARGVLPAAEMDALRAAAMEQVARGPLAGSAAGLYDEQHATGSDDPLRRFPRMLMPHHHPGLETGRLAAGLVFDRRLEPWLRALLGDEPCAAQSMFYFKPPGARGQDLHQDDFYLRSAPASCLAAWIAVDEVDEGNGGLRVAPGSHRLPLLAVRPADLGTYFAHDAVDLPPGMVLVAPRLAPGDVLFFGGAVIHGSGPNRSAERFRRSFISHYVGAGTTALNPWNRPVETFDRRVLDIPAAAVGPWQAPTTHRPH